MREVSWDCICLNLYVWSHNSYLEQHGEEKSAEASCQHLKIII